MHTLYADHLVEDQLIEFDTGCSILVAPPPEPATTGLMERTEETGDASLLQLEEIVGDGMDILHQILIEFRLCIPTAVSVQGIGNLHSVLV